MYCACLFPLLIMYARQLSGVKSVRQPCHSSSPEPVIFSTPLPSQPTPKRRNSTSPRKNKVRSGEPASKKNPRQKIRLVAPSPQRRRSGKEPAKSPSQNRHRQRQDKPKKAASSANEAENNKHTTSSAVTKAHHTSFVFTYELDGEKRFYVLFCPRKGCKSRAFNADPFVGGLAAAHFRDCNVEVGGEDDIVRRYGRPGVYPMSQSQPVVSMSAALIGHHPSSKS